MSYKARCTECDCPIWMEDDFSEHDDRRCEDCVHYDTIFGSVSEMEKP